MPDKIFRLWNSRTALSVCVLLVALAAWLLVRTGWLFVVGPQVAPAQVAEVPALSREPGTLRNLDWNLFGTPGVASPVAAPVAPASALNLHLKGVVAGPTGGYAVIAGPDGGESVYRVGDSLPGQATVEAIEARRVLLRRNGRVEALELPVELTRERRDQGAAATLPGPATPTPFAPEAASGITTASLPGIDSRFGLDPAVGAGWIVALPVASGGWRVRPGRDAGLFGELGLVTNDIVKAVNGRPLDSAPDLEAMLVEIGARGELAITLERDGRELVLRPDLDRLSGSGRP